MGCLKQKLLQLSAFAILGTVLPLGLAVDGAPLQFIGLGTTTGVTPVTLEREDDITSGIISITTGFPFANTTYTSAFVCDNGFISFGEVFCDNFPLLFPISTWNRTLISAFWSDNDIRLEGEILYEVHELGISQDSEDMLTSIGQFVSEEVGHNFEPTWMLVVEWRENHPFPHGEPNTGPGGILEDPDVQAYVALVNTYQAIAITDGTLQTYAVFTYHCEMLGWAGLPPVYAVVGYIAGGMFFENHPGSGTSDIINIACLNEPSTPWVNVVYNLTLFNPGDSSVIVSHSTSSSHPIPTPHVTMTSTSNLVMQTGINEVIHFSPVASATNRISPGEVPRPNDPGVIIIISVVVVVLIFTAATAIFLILGLACKKKKKKAQVHTAATDSMGEAPGHTTAFISKVSQTQETFLIPVST